ncbi:hypothetical protein CIK05_01425 [Bdellovibrio sp. qaytius]|nr:hypothetical protein CIK05_01425 [Bdellovibrio sp. qaytius]
MKLAVVVIIFTMIFAVQVSWAQDVSRKEKMAELKLRLLELEKQQKAFDEWYFDFYVLNKNRISPFLNEKLSIGGYFETGIINIHGPDTENQTTADLHSLGLNLTAEFSERLRFVTQTSTVVRIALENVNNNPQLTPSKRTFREMTNGTYILQGYLEYSASEFLNVQTGLGYAPYGIAFQQRETFLFHQRNGPQMISNDDGFNIAVASALWMGVHIYGVLPIFKNRTIGYNLYSMTPGSNVATLGMGGRLWWSINQFATAGTSFQYGERQQGSYFSKGLDLDIKYKQFGLLAEYASVVNSGQALDSESYYAEPYYNFLDGHWLVYVSSEYSRILDRIDLATQILDPAEKSVNGFGLNWLPYPTTRYRLGYLNHNYLHETDSTNGQKKDYEAIELSAAIAF